MTDLERRKYYLSLYAEEIGKPVSSLSLRDIIRFMRRGYITRKEAKEHLERSHGKMLENPMPHFYVETLQSKRRFDPRSFRTKITPDGEHRLTMACPVGEWSPSHQRCKVPMEVQRILHPKSERKKHGWKNPMDCSVSRHLRRNVVIADSFISRQDPQVALLLQRLKSGSATEGESKRIRRKLRRLGFRLRQHVGEHRKEPRLLPYYPRGAEEAAGEDITRVERPKIRRRRAKKNYFVGNHTISPGRGRRDRSWAMAKELVTELERSTGDYEEVLDILEHEEEIDTIMRFFPEISESEANSIRKKAIQYIYRTLEYGHIPPTGYR